MGLHTKNDQTVLDVRSPFGISEATIERTQAQWPRDMILQLHLKGLESLRIANGNVTLNGAVSIQESSPVLRLWKDGNEDCPLDEKNAYWMKLSVHHDDGSPVSELPLADGYFRLTLPTKLFEDNPRSITIRWIDFYRN